MDEFLGLRVFAACVVDVSLALLGGFLLSMVWLRGLGVAVSFFALQVCPGLLLLGACGQFLLLAMSFSGGASVHAVMRMMPSVCGTYAGGVALALCAGAGLLCVVSWVVPGRRLEWSMGLLLACCLGLRGASGHAAVDGLFSLTEALQWTHLVAMAMWSGGVLVAGIFVAPRLDQTPLLQGYLSRLSRTSTWAVGVVVLSGVVKSYRTTGGSLGLVRSSDWGHVLAIKVLLVVVTITLGGLNRRLLGSVDEVSVRRTIRTLRAEAWCMAGVLVLSAWLANLPPPME